MSSHVDAPGEGPVLEGQAESRDGGSYVEPLSTLTDDHTPSGNHVGGDASVLTGPGEVHRLTPWASRLSLGVAGVSLVASGFLSWAVVALHGQVHRADARLATERAAAISALASKAKDLEAQLQKAAPDLANVTGSVVSMRLQLNSLSSDVDGLKQSANNDGLLSRLSAVSSQEQQLEGDVSDLLSKLRSVCGDLHQLADGTNVTLSSFGYCASVL